MRKVYQDKDRQEAAIRASGLDWVIVRPTVLNDGPARGKIARADVAAFVMQQVTADTWLRQAPLITW